MQVLNEGNLLLKNVIEHVGRFLSIPLGSFLNIKPSTNHNVLLGFTQNKQV